MEYPSTRRPPSSPAWPVLVRSRSGSEKNSITANSINTSKRFSSRSKSTNRSRNGDEGLDSNNSSLIGRNKPAVNRENGNRSDGFVRFLQRGNSPRNSPATLTKKPKSTSPSAWALSPGRPLFSNVIPADESPAVGRDRGKKVKGGMSGVLKFFRQKKVSPTMEDEYHKFRVLHNRLLQWRYANAKAQSTLSSLTALAQDRLFHVWLRILNVRSVMVEKRIEIQKVKQEIKLREIIYNQMSLLNLWEKLERKNCEAVSRITRKASALSVKLPLVDHAKGEVECIYKAIREAVEVMSNIEATLTKFLSQVERNLYLATELTTTLQHQNECLEEMDNILTFVALLCAWEKSVRVQVMQQVKCYR